MIVVTQQDVIVMRMAIDTLLERVRQTERWWLAGDASVKRQQVWKLVNAILATRRNFVKDDATDIDNALMVAEGLREAALHCSEGQAGVLRAVPVVSSVWVRVGRSAESADVRFSDSRMG